MKFLKFLLFLLLGLGLAGFIAIKALSEKQPDGTGGAPADKLAQEVMDGLGKDAFDRIPYLKWEFFRAGQKYLWDKKENKALIEWGDNKVLMDLDAQTGVSYTGSKQQEGEAHNKLMQKAWSNWCNDSFWMIAPYKLLDPGTTREIIKLEDGRTGLKVSYNSGGVTPGDAYLWELDDNNRPTGYKMWTQIIPLQGMYASWEGWQDHMGATLSTVHKLAGKEASMKGVQAGNSLEELGFPSNTFDTI